MPFIKLCHPTQSTCGVRYGNLNMAIISLHKQLGLTKMLFLKLNPMSEGTEEGSKENMIK